MIHRLSIFVFSLSVMVPGCKTVEMGQYAPDPNYPPELVEDTGIDPNAPIDCSEAPMVTWNSFGKGFFVQSCQGCHYSEAPYRYGAPEHIIFDDVEDVWAQKSVVLMVSAGEMPTMPPNGGTTDLERQMLEIWLTCAPPGS